MKESLNKYFAGELTSDEKESFLMGKMEQRER